MADITYNYLLDPNIQFQDKAGNNDVNGFLRVYRNGTDTRAMTYRDFNGTANPADIPLDNNGRAVVIVDVAYEYRLEVYSREGALLWTQYPLKAMGVGDIIVNGLREVAHDSTLTGDGTEESPLGAVPEIFLAVYGQTSIGAVSAAVSAGKIVICGKSSGAAVNYAIYTGNAYGVHRFSYSQDSNVYTITLSPDGGNGTWAITSKTIPAAQVNADWDAESGVAQILNKPNLATVATTGDYNDLENLPDIPSSQLSFRYQTVAYGTIDPVTLDPGADMFDFNLSSEIGNQMSQCRHPILSLFFFANLWTPTADAPAIDPTSYLLGSMRANIEANVVDSSYSQEGTISFPITRIDGITSGDDTNFADFGFSVLVPIVNQVTEGSGTRLNFRAVPSLIVGTRMEWQYRAIVFDRS